MSECWLEKPEDRPAFRWICTAMKRLINDHKVHEKAQKNKYRGNRRETFFFFLHERENKHMWGVPGVKNRTSAKSIFCRNVE